MALTLPMDYKGISVPSARVSVVMPAIALDKSSMSFGVWYRSSPESEVFNAATYSAPYSIEGETPFRQAYEHLKSLPEFAGAIDC